ncbi:hypothetical protein QE152_g24605 [Popillia japonica]|uniref:Uncharacterized protein n=1 Tax=Popillia japonica TaxID=7064 RepID=A0AAW1K3C0_POPJA
MKLRSVEVKAAKRGGLHDLLTLIKRSERAMHLSEVKRGWFVIIKVLSVKTAKEIRMTRSREAYSSRQWL